MSVAFTVRSVYRVCSYPGKSLFNYQTRLQLIMYISTGSLVFI